MCSLAYDLFTCLSSCVHCDLNTTRTFLSEEKKKNPPSEAFSNFCVSVNLVLCCWSSSDKGTQENNVNYIIIAAIKYPIL